MAVKLPNGATVHIATNYEAAKPVTVATNAVEAVLTVTGHGFNDGDFVLLESGWGKLNERVFRIGGKTNDTFKLVGVDTSDVDVYPAGGGKGSVKRIAGWTQIPQIIEFSTSGGEQQFVDYGFLEDDYEQQIPSTQSALSITVKIADDPSLPGYKAVAKASDAGGKTPLRLVLKGGGQIVYNGYPSLNKTPEMTRNQIMAVTLAYAVSGPAARY